MTKRSQRSSSYPSYTIEYCLDLVATIYSNFGSGNYYAKREEIAKVLSISVGSLIKKVSSANQYGLLDLKTGEGYKPSQLFTSIYRPINERSKRESLIEAFKSPSLYSSLIEKFEGEVLPSEVPLANILLHHHNISDGANQKAANVFIENANNLDLLREDNILSLNKNIKNEYVEIEELENDESEKENNSELPSTDVKERYNSKEDSQNNFHDEVNYNRESIPFNIPLKGKRTAQIIVPNDVKGTDFDFIINFINLMKQQFD